MQHKFISPLTLEWYRDANGNKNSSVSSKFDTCDRLAVLLSRATLFAYIVPSYNEIIGAEVSSNGESIYNKYDLSFINDIKIDIIKETTALATDPIKSTDSLLFPLLVGREEILANQPTILKICSMLVGTKAEVSMEEIDSVFDCFDYGIASGFLKEYVTYVILKYEEQGDEPKAHISMPFCVPSIDRVGYKIIFNFNPQFTGVVSYQHGTRITSMLDFISDTTIPNITTDTYLHILSTYALTKQATFGVEDINLFNAIGSLFNIERGVGQITKQILHSRYTANVSYNTSTYYMQRLLKLIVNKVSGDKCPIGKITTYLLNLFSVNDLPTNTKAYIDILLNGNVSEEDLSDKETDLYTSEFDPTSIMFDAPTNVWVSLEADDDDPENEPEEEPVDPDPEPDPENEPEEEPVEDHEEEPKPVEVKVPRNSVALIMVAPETNTLEDYLYRLEIHNIIRFVLQNPPVDMAEEHKRLLKTFARHYVYQVSIDTLYQMVSKLIKAVPKPATKSEQ